MQKSTAKLPEWERVLSAAAQLQVQLANPMPYDLDDMLPGLAEYKGLNAAWHSWDTVKTACADAATVMFDAVSEL